MKLRITAFLALLSLALDPAHLLAQNTIVTYQGSVQDSGTNFTGPGLFQFALVTSSNANQTATATAAAPVSHFITTINVAFGGSGYVTAPAVTIFGDGTGAMATASISNGIVIAITINPGGNGSGYTNTPTVTVAPPPPAYTYTTYWSNDGTSVAGSEPSASISVNVANGLFTIALGDTTVAGMTAIDAALFGQPNLQLQIWFDDGTKGFAALFPPENLTVVPYAAFANNASNLLGSIPAGQISGMVANGLLPTNAIFSGPVTAPIFSGSGTNLTSLNAGSLTTGTVPLSSLSGITSNQLSSATWQLATNLNGGNAALASNVVSGIAITNAFITNSSFAGSGAGLTNLPASQLISIGNTNGVAAGNFFVGAAGNSAMAGYNNTGIGVHALGANTGGLDNMAAGLNALLANTSGSGNTALGTYALQANTNGSDNTAVGLNALYANSSGNNDTASGIYALYSNTNGDNTAVGAYALQGSTSGFGNTAVGYNALYTSTTGSNNIALGYLAGQAITSGSSNIDIGNVGLSGDANIIRIGSGQTAAYFPGTVFASGMALSSDRDIKRDFTPVNPETVLDKVLAMPVTEWQYKADVDVVRHIGPMAQDFHAAFDLNGSDDKHISVVDEGGVALAAIQGLNEKLNEKDAEIQALKARLDKLERLIDARTKEAK
jgi:hypothetical protein